MRAQLGGVERLREMVVEGQAWDALRDVALAEAADLLVVGSHGGRRLVGIALGSTTTELLHAAPCSVLVARPPFDPGAFPSRLVAGVDGSAPSLSALDVARSIVRAAGGHARASVIAARGSGIDDVLLERLALPLPVEYRDARPVEALVAESAAVDLVVLGARGLSGSRALGSVSERVAHRAESSVLVVRVGRLIPVARRAGGRDVRAATDRPGGGCGRPRARPPDAAVTAGSGTRPSHHTQGARSCTEPPRRDVSWCSPTRPAPGMSCSRPCGSGPTRMPPTS